MSMVQSPYRSGYQSSSSNQVGSQQSSNSIYPSLPTHLGQSQSQSQLQSHGQSQGQTQSGQMQRYNQPGPPAYGQQSQQQPQQQQQIQQSTSFGPISNHQPQQSQQQAPYGQMQQSQGQGQVQNQYGQGPSSYSTNNAFSNSFAFGPQALSSAPGGKSEDEIRLAELALAGEKVGRGMAADEEISGDMADMMQNAQAANIPAYSDIPGQSTAYHPFQITQTLPLPDELHTEMRRADVDHKGLTAKMGLFEEIGHAWFVVGSRLFLWNYGDTRDFSRYDEQNDMIESVGLIKAKRDVFIDDITHVLIVCTRTTATILGISRTEDKLNFFQTELSCQLPTRMLSISGTNSGRIFMNGENKGLYELEYTNATGWWFGSSNKVWITGRLCVPSSFLPIRTSDGVESFVVDPIQNRVFTLHTKGEIRYSEASTNGWIERGVCSQGSINTAFKNAGLTPTRVISISAIGANESRRYCLLAVTENGTRLYLSSSSFSGSGGSTSYGFPGSSSSVLARPAPQHLSSLRFSPKSFYSAGIFIGVQNNESGSSRTSTLHCYIPDCGIQPAFRENRNQHTLSPIYQEWLLSIPSAIKDQVWTVAEIPATSPTYDPPSLRRPDGLALSALARQVSVDKRQFLILSESALSWAQVTRPVDMLQAGLEVDKDALTVIHDAFGRIQLAAMGVTLGSQGDLKQADLASAVSHILTAAGGFPALSENPSGRTITYSARHDGLVLTIARLLRPLWSSNVTVMAMGGRQVLNIPAPRLQTIQTVLQKLRTFLEQNPFPRHVAQGDAKIAWDQEELSLEALQSLLKNVIEAISFLDLLDKYKLPEIVAKCDPDAQGLLSRMSFKDFLTTPEGRKVSRQLVTNLIEQQIGQEHGIDTLSETLQRECGTFSQPGDVVVYKAEENLRRAEYSRDPSERAECLAESFRLFSKAAKDITPAKVAPIAKRYHDAGFTRGAIELPLKTAAKVDPEDLALDYLRDGTRPNDRRKELYDAREECYKVVTQALGELDSKLSQAAAAGDAGAIAGRRDEAYAMAINSDDELFHRYLYDWHVNRGLAEQLLEFDTPYIEAYLRLTAADEGQEHKDLLWKYYARREEYLPAARALNDLATRDQPPMSLNDRMYYLAQGLTSAKSAASLGSEDVDFTSSLQERIDVAQVQAEVGRAIAGHKEMSAEEKNESLLQLDSRLLGLDELYQGYARPFRLYEPILLILKTADTRIEDVCEAVWRQLLRNQSGEGNETIKDAIMRDRLGDLIRRFYPSEAAPLDIVLPVIYEESSSMWQSSPDGWVTTALLDAGIGLRDVWETVAGLYERGEEDREFLEEEAGVVFSRWLKEKTSIPAAEVERFASNYLLRVGNEQLDERRLKTRKRMSEAKDAAVRY